MRYIGPSRFEAGLFGRLGVRDKIELFDYCSPMGKSRNEHFCTLDLKSKIWTSGDLGGETKYQFHAGV